MSAFDFYGNSIDDEIRRMFEEPTPNNPFKKGDEVVCVKGGHLGSGWKLGRVFVIDRFGINFSGIACAFAESGSGVYVDSLKFAKDKRETIK